MTAPPSVDEVTSLLRAVIDPELGADIVTLGMVPAVSVSPDGVVTELRPGEYRVASEATPALVADLAVWLRDRDVRLGDLRAGQRTLEEVFLALTREEST